MARERSKHAQKERRVLRATASVVVPEPDDVATAEVATRKGAFLLRRHHVAQFELAGVVVRKVALEMTQYQPVVRTVASSSNGIVIALNLARLN